MREQLERRKEPMGRFPVEFELANLEDITLAQAGVLPAEKVRRLRLRGLVDTGATDLILPAPVVAALGLQEIDRVVVRHADNRSAGRSRVGYLEVKLLDRSSVFSAIVEPDRDEALIGAMVLEALDLNANCKEQKLEPRDPHGITVAIGEHAA
jgi:predicted aspartyl protease